MRRVDIQTVIRVAVISAAEPQLEDFESLIADAQGHAEPGDFVSCQRPVLGIRVRAVVDLQGVVHPDAADQRQPALDEGVAGRIVEGARAERIGHAFELADSACRTAHANRIVTFAGIDCRGPADSLDVEQVVAGFARDVGDGAAGMRALHRQTIAAGSGCAQIEVQFLQRQVAEAAAGAEQESVGHGARSYVLDAVGEAVQCQRGIVLIVGVITRVVEVQNVVVVGALPLDAQERGDQIENAAGVLTLIADTGIASDVDDVVAVGGVDASLDKDGRDSEPVTGFA